MTTIWKVTHTANQGLIHILNEADTQIDVDAISIDSARLNQLLRFLLAVSFLANN
jgi:hypothetical protein